MASSFEMSISLGDVVATIGFIVTGIVCVLTIRANVSVLSTTVDLTDRQNDLRFSRVEAQVEDFKVEMKALNKVVVELTRAEGRMNIADERVLAQGKRIDSIATTLRDLLLKITPAGALDLPPV